MLIMSRVKQKVNIDDINCLIPYENLWCTYCFTVETIFSFNRWCLKSIGTGYVNTIIIHRQTQKWRTPTHEISKKNHYGEISILGRLMSWNILVL